MSAASRETVEAATARIGARVSAVRAARGMRVSELARQANVSSSLISQIERGSSRPSVGTLFALARSLDVPVDAFFEDPDAPLPSTSPGVLPPEPAIAASRTPVAALPSGDAATDDGGSKVVTPPPAATAHDDARYVVRRNGRASLDIRGGVRWERLTPDSLDGVEFLELVYAPGAESDSQAYRHPGIELVLVTQGVMTILLGFEQYDLEPGDSIAFPSSTPHRYVNLADVEARAVTVILRDHLSTLALSGSADDGTAVVPPARGVD